MLNLTPHAITLRNQNGIDISIEPSGTIARVASTSVDMGTGYEGLPVVKTVFGDVENVPAPNEGPFLVSALVLGQLGPEYSGVAFAPATGPNDNCIRDSKGMIQAVTKLVTV